MARHLGFDGGEIFHAERDVINTDGFFHGGSSYAASENVEGTHAIVAIGKSRIHIRPHYIT